VPCDAATRDPPGKVSQIGCKAGSTGVHESLTRGDVRDGVRRATAPRPGYPRRRPGVISKLLSRNVWFSCTIDGAEGDDSFTGHAVGWTSDKNACLVIGQDLKTPQALVSALHRAAR
jgi:hypothetical protein